MKCKCTEEDSTRTTKIEFCDICGLPREDWWGFQINNYHSINQSISETQKRLLDDFCEHADIEQEQKGELQMVIDMLITLEKLK
jgi:hypothetical protein